MLCTLCPPTILGDFYGVPEKSPKSSADKMHRAWESKDQTLKKIRALHFPEIGKVYHPFQNHYTHEVILFELFRGLHLQLSGVFRKMLSITVAVCLFFLQNAVTGNNFPWNFPRIFGNYSYMI